MRRQLRAFELLASANLISALFCFTGCGIAPASGSGSSSGDSRPTMAFVTTPPINQTVTIGEAATFVVIAGGTTPLGYQWQKNGTSISGATAASYTTPATTEADNGTRFDVVVSNSVGTVTSSSATLTVRTVTAGPTIITQPADQIVTKGQTATFSVTASGSGSMTYQWRKNAVDIGGATSANYTTPPTAT